MLIGGFNMVRKKTAEQIAEEQAIALQQRVEKWCNLSAQASDDLDADEKALEELKKRIAQKKRTIGTARKFVREKYAIKFYETVIRSFGLTQKESGCKTEEDFNNLLEDVLAKLKSLNGTVDEVKMSEPEPEKEISVKVEEEPNKDKEIVKKISVQNPEPGTVAEQSAKAKEEVSNSAEEKLVEVKNKLKQDSEPKSLFETSGEVKSPELEPVVEQPSKVEEEKPSSPEETSDKVDKELETVTESKPEVKEPEAVIQESMPVTEKDLSEPEQKTEPKPVTVEESLPKSKKNMSYKYKGNAKIGSYQPQKK